MKFGLKTQMNHIEWSSSYKIFDICFCFWNGIIWQNLLSDSEKHSNSHNHSELFLTLSITWDTFTQWKDSIEIYPSLLILFFFKTNRNPTEYDPGAFKSMNAWIPALSTAFQHSIQNIFFPFLFFNNRQSGNTWPQHTVIFTTILQPFSLLCKSMRVS